MSVRLQNQINRLKGKVEKLEEDRSADQKIITELKRQNALILGNVEKYIAIGVENAFKQFDVVIQGDDQPSINDQLKDELNGKQ